MGRLQRAPNPLFPAAGVAAQERGGNGVACKVVKTKRGLNPNEAACCKNKVASRRNKVGLCFFRVRPCFFRRDGGSTIAVQQLYGAAPIAAGNSVC